MYYHVTTEKSADRILHEGLKPRGLTKKRTVWGVDDPSIPQYCYMCTAKQKALVIKMSLAGDDPETKYELLAIDEAQLDKDLLRPDEDWLTDSIVAPLCTLLGELAKYGINIDLDTPTFSIQSYIESRWSSLAPLFRQDFDLDDVDGQWLSINGTEILYAQIERWYSWLTSGQSFRAFKCVELFSFLWPECDRINDTVAYKGIVPPSAISILP